MEEQWRPTCLASGLHRQIQPQLSWRRKPDISHKSWWMGYYLLWGKTEIWHKVWEGGRGTWKPTSTLDMKTGGSIERYFFLKVRFEIWMETYFSITFYRHLLVGRSVLHVCSLFLWRLGPKKRPDSSSTIYNSSKMEPEIRQIWLGWA